MGSRIQAKPFLKWAGGKTQLLVDLAQRLPKKIKETRIINTYIEPFVGGGAFFFYLRGRYELKNVYLMDINKELMLGYMVIQREPDALISGLGQLADEYLALDATARKDYYYMVRERYNQEMHAFNYQSFGASWIRRACYLVFLNKTCFNGLFRQNKKGEFNVPYGRYKNPTICDASNITKVSKALAGVKLICADFHSSEAYIKANSLVYFDPPYRPLSETAKFTSYAKGNFTDEDQIGLAKYFRKLDKRNAFLLLSNSDPMVANHQDDFFDHLYQGFRIERVFARRSINRDGYKRGEITELIISNY